MELAIGGEYNWIGQPERLIYTGKAGSWYQFSLVGRDDVWCEVLFGDLIMFEKTEKNHIGEQHGE